MPIWMPVSSLSWTTQFSTTLLAPWMWMPLSFAFMTSKPFTCVQSALTLMPRSVFSGSTPFERRGCAEKLRIGRVVALGAAMNLQLLDDVPPRVDWIYIEALKLYVPDLKQMDQFGLVPAQGTLPDAPDGGGHIVSYAFWNVANGAASLPGRRVGAARRHPVVAAHAWSPGHPCRGAATGACEPVVPPRPAFSRPCRRYRSCRRAPPSTARARAAGRPAAPSRRAARAGRRSRRSGRPRCRRRSRGSGRPRCRRRPRRIRRPCVAVVPALARRPAPTPLVPAVAVVPAPPSSPPFRSSPPFPRSFPLPVPSPSPVGAQPAAPCKGAKNENKSTVRHR